MIPRRAKRNVEEKMDVDEAVRVIMRDYYGDVHSWGDGFISRIEKGEWESRDDFIEAMDQEIDSAERVIYTKQAILGILVSENHDAIFDEGMEVDCSEGIPWSQIMYFAFRQDIIEYIGRQDVDIDDDATFEGEGEEDEEDEDEEDEEEEDRK